MKEFKAMNFNGVAVVDSRQVAEAIEKAHHKLLRDIRTYCDYLNESKIGLVDFFIESTYTDSKGEERPCYLCTKKGCEMIAHKLTGKKGVIFTARYINAFYEMEQQKCIDCRIFEKLDYMNANINSLRAEIKERADEMKMKFITDSTIDSVTRVKAYALTEKLRVQSEHFKETCLAYALFALKNKNNIQRKRIFYVII